MAEEERWEVDPLRSTVAFKVRHLVVSWARGRFRRFQGVVRMPPGDPSRATVEAQVETASVDTGMADRDDALRATDYFDPGRYPQMAFRSISVRDRGRGRLTVAGELSIKTVRRPLALEVELLPPRRAGAEERRLARANGALSRKEFGLVWSPTIETGGVAVGDKVELELEVELVRR